MWPLTPIGRVILRHLSSQRCLALMAVPLVGISCCSSPGQLVMDDGEMVISRIEQTGSYSLDIVAGSRWNDVSKALQPQFKLDESGALTQVLPTSGVSDFSRLRQTQFGLSVGLIDPFTSTTSTTTQNQQLDPITLEPIDDAPENIATRETTIFDSDGNAVTAEAVTPPTVTTTLAPLTAGTLDVQPQLKYEQAAALLQHVRLLNRRVADMLLKPNYTPYVLTVKLTNQPIRQDLPLDVYYDIGFFLNGTYGETNDNNEDENRERRSSIARLAGQEAYSVSPESASASPSSESINEMPAVIVESLLTTDSLELEQRSVSDADVDAIALRLAASLKAAGADVSFSDLRQEIDRRLGRRSNSLLNLVRLTDNVLRVRVGAAFSPESAGDDPQDRSMVAREHTFLAVVMIPNRALEMQIPIAVMARPHARKAQNGWRLWDGTNPGRANLMGDETELIESFFRGREWEEGYTSEQLREVANEEGLKGFAAQVLDLSGEQATQWDSMAILWLALHGAVDGPILVDGFTFPDGSETHRPQLDPTAAARMFVGAKSPTLVELDGEGVSGMNHLQHPLAWLRLTWNDGIQNRTFEAPAVGVKAARQGTALQVTFPPLEVIPLPVELNRRIGTGDLRLQTFRAAINRQELVLSWEKAVPDDGHVVTRTPDKEIEITQVFEIARPEQPQQTWPTLETSASVLPLVTGQPAGVDVPFRVQQNPNQPSSLVIHVSNAILVDANGGALIEQPLPNAATSAVLRLRNLVPNVPVDVHLSVVENGKRTQTTKVVSLPVVPVTGG